MTDTTWRDRLAGHRMQVDEQFAPQVRDSPLTNGEWNLVMTAVEFDIEGEGEHARLVADTSKLDSVVPEFETMRQRGPGVSRSRPEPVDGVLDSVKNVLGIDSFNDVLDLEPLEDRLGRDLRGPLGLGSGSGDDEKIQAAVHLAESYTRELQAHLEEQGRWESIRRAAAGGSSE
jgi:hypothetical protein